MHLPVVLLATPGRPHLVATDLRTGEQRSVITPSDSEVVIDRPLVPALVGTGILAGNWLLPADLDGQGVHVGSPVAVTAGSVWKSSHNTLTAVTLGQQRSFSKPDGLAGRKIVGEVENGVVLSEGKFRHPSQMFNVLDLESGSRVHSSSDYLSSAGTCIVAGTQSELWLEEVGRDGRHPLALPEGCDDWPLRYKWSVAPGGRFIKADMWRGPIVVVDTLERRLVVSKHPAPGSSYSSSVWTTDGRILMVEGDVATVFDPANGEHLTQPIEPRQALYRSMVAGLTGFTALDELPHVVRHPDYEPPVVTLEEAFERLEAQVPANEVGRVRESSKPALTLVRVPENDSPLPPGSSRFGGLPDAYPGFEWPSEAGLRLAFFAQINLREASALIPTPFPSSGLLLLFIRDFGDHASATGKQFFEGAVRAVRVAEDDVVEGSQWPEDLEIEFRYPEMPMALVPQVSLDHEWHCSDAKCLCQHLAPVREGVDEPHQFLGHHGLSFDDRELVVRIGSDQWCGVTWADGGRAYLLADHGGSGLANARTFVEEG